MRILTITTLYPNSIQRHLGVFVENKLRHLVSEGSIEARVIAPVRTETRAYAEQFSRDENTRGQLELFRSIVERRTAL